MTTALWVLVIFSFLASLCTFVFFAGGALVALIADLSQRQDDE